MRSLYDSMAQHAAERPDAPFIIQAETGETLTYADTYAAVCTLSRALGTAPRRVALCLPNGVANAAVWLAALIGGHTLIPIAADAPAPERARLAHCYTPNVLVVEHSATARDFDCPSAHVLTLADCHRQIARARGQVGVRAPEFWAREGRVCLATSGSTGEPKGVMLDATQIAWTAEQIRDAHQLTLADRGLTVLPFFHVNAPVVSLCASLVTGSTVVVAEGFHRSRFWEWVERYEITWASIVPTILAMLLSTERPDFLPGALRFVRTASAPLPAVHLRAFERRFGVPVVETYGLSEAAATVTANPVPPGVHKAGSVGLPAGVALRICRPRDREEEPERVGASETVSAVPLQDMGHGETGEVCIAGPSVIAGYLGGGDRESFANGWFRTGDLGYLDGDGYLFLTGRLRDVIIHGGENIAPREVEETLLAAPDVEDAAVVGAPDPIYGQRIVAYIVPGRTWTAARERQLRAFCAERLSAAKVPAAFIAVQVLPRTRSGKLARITLREEALVQREAAG